jgi:hypothetical protein
MEIETKFSILAFRQVSTDVSFSLQWYSINKRDQQKNVIVFRLFIYVGFYGKTIVILLEILDIFLL